MLAEGRLSRHYEGDVFNTYLSHVLVDVAEMLKDIEALTRNGMEGHPPFADYTFTDISTGFFENARVKLGKWSQRVSYKKLDISQGP